METRASYDFQQAAQDRINEFLSKKTKVDSVRATQKTKSAPAISHLVGYQVTIAVRKKRLSTDFIFSHTSYKTSRIEAQIEASHRARDAGWSIIGHYIDVVPLHRK